MQKYLWTQCKGGGLIGSLNETVWRIVEAQEISATRKLVDSLEEQAILEYMLESSKPPIINKYLDYHRLLYTPFRYPPLKYGSRFGSKIEPSLWYGSLELSTAMAEKAFYKFNFLRASKAKYNIVEERLTTFSSHIKTNQGIDLTASPFSKYIDIISSPISYEETQQLGSSMRSAEIKAFKFISARDVNRGMNIALFSPTAFLKKQPNAKSFQTWECIAHHNQMEFVRSNSMATESISFVVDQFMIDGVLPFPGG
jgi:hypothetical protein